ncbi:MAG: hypothetical protein HUU33_04060 [Flavobacteriales bacterium]|nr:hypothetical protein [Flavobacteriales bacterium]
MRTVAAALCLAAAGAPALAQVDPEVPRDLIEQRIEAATEQLGDDSDVDLTNLFDVLTDHYRDPIDLNHTDAAELNTLALLTDVQIGALLDHIRRHGKLLSVYEVQTIDAWDARTLALVRPFITVREDALRSRAGLKEILRNGEHEVVVRAIANVEARRGGMDRAGLFGGRYTDPDGDALPDTGDEAVRDSLRRESRLYLGDPYKLYARYRFRYRNNISLGITAEKDEGEEFFRGTQTRGFDFYSAHFFLRHYGRLKALAVGDYQAQFGLGLTYWSGLAFASKSSFSLNVKRNAAGLMPYTSVNENLFNRGVAATVELHRDLDLTVFYSRKGVDANVQQEVDSSDVDDAQVSFSSFQEDGYHRTYNELVKRNAIREQGYGGHLRYHRRSFSWGLTGARVDYDVPLARTARPYNRFEFNGQHNTTVGSDFSWLHRNASFFGEVAASLPQADGRTGWALNLGTLVAVDRRVTLALLYRHYARDFHGLNSVGFAEGGNPWNERGLYTGLEVRPDRRWTINAYFDQYRFPWLRSQVDAPSDGHDVLVQVTWRPSRQMELYLRGRHEQKGYNSEAPEAGIDPLVRRRQTNWRFNATYKVSPAVSLRTRVEAVDVQRGDSPVEHGFIVYQDVVHRPLRSWWELTLRLALFDTDGYDARLYAYENDLIGVFSIPPYYGRGMRWYAMLRLTPLRRVDLWLRYGAFILQDTDRIGSGLQEIAGPMRSDVKVQVRVRF